MRSALAACGVSCESAHSERCREARLEAAQRMRKSCSSARAQSRHPFSGAANLISCSDYLLQSQVFELSKPPEDQLNQPATWRRERDSKLWAAGRQSLAPARQSDLWLTSSAAFAFINRRRWLRAASSSGQLSPSKTSAPNSNLQREAQFKVSGRSPDSGRALRDLFCHLNCRREVKHAPPLLITAIRSSIATKRCALERLLTCTHFIGRQELSSGAGGPRARGSFEQQRKHLLCARGKSR